MQKLSVELKNTPRNTPLVPCSVSSWLNREETLSAVNKVLTDNNSKVDLPVLPVSEKALKAIKKLVFVLNEDWHSSAKTLVWASSPVVRAVG